MFVSKFNLFYEVYMNDTRNFLCFFFWQIAEQKETIRFELESLDFRPDVEPELTDLIHAVSNNNFDLEIKFPVSYYS